VRAAPERSGDRPRLRALFVAYNPTMKELTDTLEIPFAIAGMPPDGWMVIPNTGSPARFENGKVTISVAPLDAAWCELERDV
jgi:hypothetical protein